MPLPILTIALGLLFGVDSTTPPAPALSACTFPATVKTERDYAQWLDQEDQALRRAASVLEGAGRAQALAHHANWTLSARCEPQVTRLLLGLHDPHDLVQLAALAKEAEGLIHGARAEWPASNEEGIEQLEMLGHFSRAFQRTAEARLGQHNRAALDETANELAIWIDEDDPAVAGAALLWQSLLYQLGGKTERAFQALPLALSPIKDDPAAFHLRLLRCSLLADVGRSTVAQALLLKMEEQCADWFSAEATQQDALCTATWLRLRIIESRKPPAGKIPQKALQGMRHNAQTVLGSDQTPCRLLRIGHAIPLVVTRPETPPSGP